MNSMIFSRFKLLILVLILLLLWQSVKFFPWLQPFKERATDHESTPSGPFKPVLVSVFYEALCSDSKNFIVKQLLPSVNKAPRLFNISLIPYGKAKTERDAKGNFKFACQHGPTECLANKIHACAISKIPNTTVQVKYISCMISDNVIPELAAENCAKDLGIDWVSIVQCSNSAKGSKLFSEFGKVTEKSVPQISFVPTILLDNKSGNQAEILKNLFTEACSVFKELPEECIQPY